MKQKPTNIPPIILSEGIKQFNRFAWIPCEPEQMQLLEAQYILKFQPKYNKYLPSILGYLMPKSLKKRLNVDLRSIRKVITKYKPRNVNGRYQIEEIRELLQTEGILQKNSTISE